MLDSMGQLCTASVWPHGRARFAHLVFWANCSFFAQKWANEWFAQKKQAFHSFAHFWWEPERYANIAHQKKIYI